MVEISAHTVMPPFLFVQQEEFPYEYRSADSGTEAEKELLKLAEKYSHFTIPLLIMDGDRFIGGYDDFQRTRQQK